MQHQDGTEDMRYLIAVGIVVLILTIGFIAMQPRGNPLDP
jgi:hypothetical protein